MRFILVLTLLYYGNEGKLEYDLIVAPGADPQKIRLRFRGAEKIRINAQGDIVLKVGDRFVILHKPVVYQETGLLDAPKQYGNGRYVAKNAYEFGFRIDSYDPVRPLVIDPALTYSTYLGGSNGDQGYRVAADAAGNAYVVGLYQFHRFSHCQRYVPLQYWLHGRVYRQN